MIFVGIDPGVAGGIAAIDERRRIVFSAKMPDTVADLVGFLRTVAGHDFATCILERVHSMPGQGHSGAWTFGRGFGRLEVAIHVAPMPVDLVSPRVWQKAMGVIYPKKATDTVRKNISKARAQQLFPRQALTITHALADALLMADYCRRLHGVSNGKEGKARRAQGHTEARREEGKGYRSQELEQLATASQAAPAAAGAHPGHAHQAARRSDRHPQRSARHDRGGVDGRED